MGDWREKEWDEPGPDFGKTFYVKRRPVTEVCKPYLRTQEDHPEIEIPKEEK